MSKSGKSKEKQIGKQVEAMFDQLVNSDEGLKELLAKYPLEEAEKEHLYSSAAEIINLLEEEHNRAMKEKERSKKPGVDDYLKSKYPKGKGDAGSKMTRSQLLDSISRDGRMSSKEFSDLGELVGFGDDEFARTQVEERLKNQMRWEVCKTFLRATDKKYAEEAKTAAQALNKLQDKINAEIDEREKKLGEILDTIEEEENHKILTAEEHRDRIAKALNHSGSKMVPPTLEKVYEIRKELDRVKRQSQEVEESVKNLTNFRSPETDDLPAETLHEVFDEDLDKMLYDLERLEKYGKKLREKAFGSYKKMKGSGEEEPEEPPKGPGPFYSYKDLKRNMFQEGIKRQEKVLATQAELGLSSCDELSVSDLSILSDEDYEEIFENPLKKLGYKKRPKTPTPQGSKPESAGQSGETSKTSQKSGSKDVRIPKKDSKLSTTDSGSKLGMGDSKKSTVSSGIKTTSSISKSSGAIPKVPRTASGSAASKITPGKSDESQSLKKSSDKSNPSRSTVKSTASKTRISSAKKSR